MRLRFFFIIFAVLFVVTLSSVVIHTIFVKSERRSLIDQQVRETASALVDTQLANQRIIDFDKADAIISDELGQSRIGKFFVIRNSKDEIIFQTKSAELLGLSNAPRDKQWFEISTNGKYIRGLNLKLPRIEDRTLQAGLVLDESIVNPNFLSAQSIIFIAVISILGLIASFVLTSFLLNPVAKLEKFLTDVCEQAKNRSRLATVPEYMAGKSVLKSNDEFYKMVAGLNALIDMLNKNYRFSRLWAYQMAHELKTPLAILNLEIERLQKKKSLSQDEISAMTTEGLKISETINSFLGWAELENSPQQKNLFANRLGAIATSVVRRLENSHPGRIQLKIESDPIVVAAPQHVEQVISNLLSNALTYSPKTEPVLVRISDGSLSIIDRGSGIPSDVLERIGEPFNRGIFGQSRPQGHGLGLAWVSSICRLYSFEMEVLPSPQGSTVKVTFSPKDDLVNFGTAGVAASISPSPAPC